MHQSVHSFLAILDWRVERLYVDDVPSDCQWSSTLLFNSTLSANPFVHDRYHHFCRLLSFTLCVLRCILSSPFDGSCTVFVHSFNFESLLPQLLNVPRLTISSLILSRHFDRFYCQDAYSTSSQTFFFMTIAYIVQRLACTTFLREKTFISIFHSTVRNFTDSLSFSLSIARPV